MISHLIQLLSADAAKVFFTFLIIVMLLMEPSIFSTLFSLCRATGLTSWDLRLRQLAALGTQGVKLKQLKEKTYPE